MKIRALPVAVVLEGRTTTAGGALKVKRKVSENAKNMGPGISSPDFL